MQFINCVRFLVKSEYVDEYIEINKSFTLLPGQIMGKLIKTGDRTFCFIGMWDSEESISAERENMISQLNQVRHMLDEISPELGVTDPVSGSVVIDFN